MPQKRPASFRLNPEKPTLLAFLWLSFVTPGRGRTKVASSPLRVGEVD